MNAIEAESVSFSYGKRSPMVLKDIDLVCEKGSINTLIGLNGCGKTTLIRILAGLERPLSGKVTCDGRDISQMTQKERSQEISYVQQKQITVSDYKVRDYLLFGTANRLDFFDSPSDQEYGAVDDVMRRFGIESFRNKNLGELSGGERQIVSICAAMVQDSNIMLLDEPCSALDFMFQDKVLSTLRDIAKNDGKTVIMTTHNPNHALNLESNVFLMKDGAIVESGNAEEVICPEKLSTIYGTKICYSSDVGYKEVSYRK